MTSTLPAIRTVFFDMGNVLVRFSHDILVRQVAVVCHTSERDVRQLLFREQKLLEFERGEYTEPEFIQLLEERFQVRINPDAFRDAFADIFTLTPGIVPLLHRVAATDTQLVLLSNTSVTHLRFIERHFDVLSFMHERVTSFEVGASKPDPAIYTAALAKASSPVHQCFYTDDIADYVSAASRLGITSHQFVGCTQLEYSLIQFGVLSP